MGGFGLYKGSSGDGTQSAIRKFRVPDSIRLLEVLNERFNPVIGSSNTEGSVSTEAVPGTGLSLRLGSSRARIQTRSRKFWNPCSIVV